MVGFGSAPVFAERNIENPVQTVFNAPMRTHRISIRERFSVGQAGKNVTLMNGNFSFNLPCAADACNPCKLTPSGNIQEAEVGE